jgi:hypothetical protein
MPAMQPRRVSALRNGTSQFEHHRGNSVYTYSQVKFTTDFTGYAPAGKLFRMSYTLPFTMGDELFVGYISDPSQKARGMSPLHDSGTGSSLGTYGNFEIMPLLCPSGFDTCTTTLEARERYRKNDSDGMASCVVWKS